MKNFLKAFALYLAFAAAAFWLISAHRAHAEEAPGARQFVGVILVCLSSVPRANCDESKALDVISTRVENEFACLHGFQETIARGGLREGLAEGRLYIKTRCDRG